MSGSSFSQVGADRTVWPPVSGSRDDKACFSKARGFDSVAAGSRVAPPPPTQKNLKTKLTLELAFFGFVPKPTHAVVILLPPIQPWVKSELATKMCHKIVMAKSCLM